jgi:hypothetical protein
MDAVSHESSNHQPAPTMRKRLLIGTGIALGVFVAYFAWQIAGPPEPIVVSPQTTVITSPLADDGLPDYSAYLLAKMKEGVTPENNGAIPFLNAMWPAGLDTEHQAIICDELEMEMPQREGIADPYQDKSLLEELADWLGVPKPTQEELDAGGWSETNTADDPSELDYLWALDERPWTAGEAPAVAKWIDSHAGDYELLQRAATFEQFYLPSPTLLTEPKADLQLVLLPSADSLRNASRLLRLRANLRIGSGDFAGAWQDCLAIHQLSEFRTHPCVVSEIISYKCEELANEVMLRLLESPVVPSELVDEISRFLAQQKPRHDMISALREGEALSLVTSVLELSGVRPGPQNLFGRPLENAHRPTLPVEWNEVLRSTNEQYERLIRAWEQPTYQERVKAVDAWYAQLPNVNHNLQGFSDHLPLVVSRDARTDYMTGLVISTIFTGPLDYEDRHLTNQLLHRIAVAISQYKIENGSYPNSLAELIPENLNAIPIDLFGNPLAYRRTSDGYLLYSLGPNGKDDEGSRGPRSIYKGHRVADTETEDDLLRAALGEPPRPEPEVIEEPVVDADPDNPFANPSTPLDLLTPPENSDDIAIRLPLIPRPLPKFNPNTE